MRFKDKVVMVTGSAKGIGKAAALRFAKEGAVAVILDWDETALKTVSDEFKSMNLLCEAYQLDVSNKENVTKVVADLETKYGKIDVLVNNAGITRDNFLVRMEEKAWDDVINVNLKGVFICGQAVAKVMMKKKSGRIINTSSVVGIFGNVGQSNYSATKGGVIAMTKTWAKELGRYNITVNAVAPGFIKTEMTEKLPEKVINMMQDRIALARMGETDDIANAYMFLASEEASYITGTVISVDGGMSL